MLGYLAHTEGRITVVHLGKNPSTGRCRHTTRHHPRLHMFTVLARRDIPQIVLGQVRHDLGGFQTER